ncbi:molybdopterin-guanine dinucleotide biosynthesis protein B [Candidatus Bipolaricaulota bacterium]|nr:molybdopterin-guanine dinucleotide biosynthesis protein B [Candidatus Bipolaricaulota bacterium]
MATPPVVTIYGNSDSGKTGLVGKLIEEFSEDGLEVCTIKHSPGDLSLDKEDKDTWSHKQAGSQLTVLSTDVETSFLVPREMKLEEIVEAMVRIKDPDLVIAEGYKNAEVPKVAVGDIDPRDSTIHEYDGGFSALKGKIYDLIAVKDIENELPGLDCGKCGYVSCNELAEKIYEGDRELSDCKIREQRLVDLKVNGEDVPLEYFPAQVVEGGLKGMLKALKGVDDEINRISLEIRD